MLVLLRNMNTWYVDFLQANGETFEFPDLFKDKKTPMGKHLEDMERMIKITDNEQHDTWHTADIPEYFR